MSGAAKRSHATLMRLTWAAPGNVVVECRYAEARTSAAAVNAARWSGGITAHLLSGYVVTLSSAPTHRASACRLCLSTGSPGVRECCGTTLP